MRVRTIYLIAVAALLTDRALAQSPPNDNFAAAEVIEGLSGSVAGTNINATCESGEPSTCSGHSVWYRWRSPADTEIVFTSSAIVTINVFEGQDLLSLQQTSPCISNFPFLMRTVLRVGTGIEYFIAIDGFDAIPSQEHSFQLSWAPPGSGPSNDNLANAIAIVGAEGSVTGTAVDATQECDEPEIPTRGFFATTSGQSVWYHWIAPETGDFAFTTDGSSFDTLLAIYEGDEFTSLVQLDANDDSGDNNGTGPSKVRFRAQEGHVYSIAVDRYSQPAAFRLNWAPRPRNDDFETAETLTGTQGIVSRSTLAASLQEGEKPPTELYRSIWFGWETSVAQRLTFNIGQPRAKVTIYTGAILGELTEVAPASQQAVFSADTGIRFWIAVTTANLFESVVLRWAPTPPNDARETPTSIDGSFGSIVGDNTGATTVDTEEYYPGAAVPHSVWYVWEAPRDGLATFEVIGEDSNLAVAIFLSPGAFGGGPVARQMLDATAGTRYAIAVGGAGGPFALYWSLQEVTATPTASPTPTFTATSSHTPSATLTMAPTHTPTPNATHTFTATETSTPAPTPSLTVTPSATMTPSPEPSPMATATETSTPIPTTSACSGDCNRDNAVTIDELVLGVGIALGHAEITACVAMDTNQDGEITIDELVQAVSRALEGC